MFTFTEIFLKMETCTKCKAQKPISEFVRSYRKNAAPGEVGSWCKKCHTAAGTAYHKARPHFKDIVSDSVREHRFKKKYGITTKDYHEMLDKQGGGCAICKGDRRTTIKGHTRLFAVDHDHRTGKVRGLLCEQCNRGIGLLQDDADIVKSAYNYIVKHK